MVIPAIVEAAVAHLLQTLDVDLTDPNYEETPHRFATYLVDHFRSPVAVRNEIDQMGEKVFPTDYRGVVTVGPSRAYGMCPHHLLPVVYDIWVGYIAETKAIGLSKLVRIPRLRATIPALQEDITTGIASDISRLLATEHVACYVRGTHFCMVCRGAREDHATTTTSVMQGFFGANDHAAKEEFLSIVRSK